MNNKSVLTAIDEARRFIERAADVLEEHKKFHIDYFGTKKTGALRRSSLDLTRALADLRRP